MCMCGRDYVIGHVHFIADQDVLERVCCRCFEVIAGLDHSNTVGYVDGGGPAPKRGTSWRAGFVMNKPSA